MKAKKAQNQDVFIHLRLDPQLKSILKGEAEANGRSLSNYIFTLIAEARVNRLLQYKHK